MNEKEVKFMDKLYKDLYLSNSLKKHTTLKDKYQSIIEYIEILEKIHNEMLNHNHIDTLKRMYYDKYVIKENDIPDSYYKNQEEMYLERGYGHITLSNEERKELQEQIINDQKKSLDVWLDYFLSEDSSYIPFWAKYWAFQGMLKLGSFDKEKGKYLKRTKHTVSKFADLNREALALSIDALLNFLNRKEISDKELEKLVKTGSFQTIYTYILNTVLSNNSNIIKRSEGKWIKYNQGSDPMPLVNSLQGYNTGWCTAGKETAELQLKCGDFYVYYTKDENDEYKVPRIAIRMEYDSIGEIRGIGEHQNLEPEMEEAVKEKIKDFPDKDIYYKKIRDMDLLTKIYKNYKTQKLTKEELRFLYEIDSNIEGFGYETDPRIKEILKNRNIREDLAFIFDIDKSQVATNNKELSKKTVVYYGNLDKSRSSHVNLPNLRYVIGDCNFLNLKNSEGIRNLKKVTRCARFNSLRSAKNLENLEYIGESVFFNNLEYSTGLKNLKYIGGKAYFPSLKDTTDLQNLEYIGYDASFDSLEVLQGLNNLKYIGELAIFMDVKIINGLENLEYIGEAALFDSLEILHGLNRLKHIGGSSRFYSLLYAEELESLEYIGKDARFYSIKNLPKKLKYIGGDAHFEELEEDIDKENLPEIKGRIYSDVLENYINDKFIKK